MYRFPYDLHAARNIRCFIRVLVCCGRRELPPEDTEGDIALTFVSVSVNGEWTSVTFDRNVGGNDASVSVDQVCVLIVFSSGCFSFSFSSIVMNTDG